MDANDTIDRQQPLALVVEDIDPVRRVLTTILARAGFRVLSARTAAAAVALVDASAMCPVALVVDVVLPDGHARDLVALLRARCPAARLVLVSGHVHVDCEALGAELGAVFLRKPFGVRELLAAVRSRAA